ncbi:MAG: hypothetical protein EYC70_13260 [Planctomycetota bacterium]|nr:MAG: hypothetical protein EYC70_13260 [Planctomycetota bacterium]
MLSFATELPIDHAHNPGDFLGTVEKWILGSPHTRLVAGDLVALATESEARIQCDNESIDTLRVVDTEEQAAGIRHVRRDGGLEWIMTAVFSRTEADTWVGVRVSCESSHPAARLPPAKKPVLIKTILETLGGACDGVLLVSDSATYLDNTDIALAARLIRGQSGCRLPIVYVSAGFQGNHIVEPARLARGLAGMAHVVVEPNRAFSLRLKVEVGSSNVYGGTIGIYWPDGGGRRSFFLGGEYASPGGVARGIFDEIRTALTNRRPFDRCTWAYVQENASRQMIRALQASGSQEVEKYIQTFDKEVAAKTQRLDEANKEIMRLHNELRICEARLPAGTGSLLQTGSEQDLYPNEILSIVREAVADARARVGSDSRRHHVLDAVLHANPPTENDAGYQRERLKKLLRGYKSMDARLKRSLEEMGFSVSEDGKHYKLTFQGDDRYTFTLPKTGSDHRGGLNAASDIGRLLF